MHTSEELNLKLLSELRKIGIELGIKDLKGIAKQDLIEKILEKQSNAPAAIFGEPFSTINNSSVPENTDEIPLLEETEKTAETPSLRKRVPKDVKEQSSQLFKQTKLNSPPKVSNLKILIILKIQRHSN